jgi:hypothetical protein
MAWSFVDIYELSFTAEEMRALPKWEGALLVASSLAANEITMLQRQVYTSQNGKAFTGRSKVSELLIYNQTVSLDRVFSAKLVEYVRLFDGYAKRCERDGRSPIVAIAGLSDIIASADYDFALWLRGKFTNHYVLSEIAQMIDGIQDGETFDFILHQKNWNSWYPLGDQVVLISALKSRGDPAAIIRKWHEWMHSTYRWMTDTQSNLVSEIVENHFPYKKATPKREIVDQRLIGSFETMATPIFWDIADDGMDR